MAQGRASATSNSRPTTWNGPSSFYAAVAGWEFGEMEGFPTTACSGTSPSAGGGRRQARRERRRRGPGLHRRRRSSKAAVAAATAERRRRSSRHAARTSRARAGTPAVRDPEGNERPRSSDRATPGALDPRCASSTATATSTPTASRPTPTRSSARPGWPASSGSSSRAGTSPRRERALALVERFAWLDAAVGVHPHDAAKVDDGGLGADRRAGRADPRVVAIGETGLDYDRVFSPIPDQLTNLRRNLALALETGQAGDPPLPVGDGPARRPGRAGRGAPRGRRRRSCLGGGVRGPTAGGHPLVLRAGRLRARRSSTSASRSASPGSSSGRARRHRPRSPRSCPADRAARRDRFAVPLAAGRATLAQRTGVGARHSGMAGRATRRRLPTRSARTWSPPTTGVSEPSGGRHDARGRRCLVGRPRRRGRRLRVCCRRPARAPSSAPSPRRRAAAAPVPRRRLRPAAHRRPRPRPQRASSSPQTGVLPSDRLSTVEVASGCRPRSSSRSPSASGSIDAGRGAHAGALEVAVPPFIGGSSGLPIDVDGEHVAADRASRACRSSNDVGQPTYDGTREIEATDLPERSGTSSCTTSSKGTIGWYIGYDGPGCVSLSPRGRQRRARHRGRTRQLTAEPRPG